MSKDPAAADINATYYPSIGNNSVKYKYSNSSQLNICSTLRTQHNSTYYPATVAQNNKHRHNPLTNDVGLWLFISTPRRQQVQKSTYL